MDPIWKKNNKSTKIPSSGHQEGRSHCLWQIGCVNSLAPGKFEWNFRHVIFKQILVIDDCDISCEIALIWMSLDFTDDQSTLVQVMACCRQATSHYMSQCWPRSQLPYGGTRPQWVKYQHNINCQQRLHYQFIYQFPWPCSQHPPFNIHLAHIVDV